MGVRRTPRTLAVLLVVLAPSAAPLAAEPPGLPGPPGLPAAALPALPGPHLGDIEGFAGLRELLLRRAPAPAGTLEAAVAAWPWPFGLSPGERLLAALDAEPAPGAGEGPAVVVSGAVDLTADWTVSGSLVLSNATVRFLAPDVDIRVGGALTIHDSVLRTEGLAPSARGSVEARAALDVRRSTFAGVALAVRDAGGASALVAESTFRDHQGSGVVADRPEVEVRHSTFVNLTVGVEVTGARGRPQAGPVVHNNTLQMTGYALQVGGASAGTYRHNTARANFQAVACTTAGAQDAQGVKHRPRFFENNLHTNYGEAIAGLRGIHVVTPLGNVSIPNSACDHERPYLGPSGAARDTTFLSSDDTLTAVQSSPLAGSAPPLPLPLLEITDARTWTGTRTLDGPVVVNSPGSLVVEDAAVLGAFLLGAKAGGRLEVRRTTVDPLAPVVLRNAADVVEDSTLGGPESGSPLVLYRCNCTLRGSDLASGGVLGVAASGGLLTDDTAWRPTIAGNTFRGRGVGLTLANVKATVEENEVLGGAVGVLDALGTTTFRDNVVQGAAVAVTGVLDTWTSTDNRYEAGNLGVVSAIATSSHTRDVVAGYQIGLLPVLPAAFSATLGNVTFNAVGLMAALGVATVTTTNFVDNYLLAMATVPIDTGDVDVPSGITCSTCWGPADEARWGNVTYVAALGPNGAPQPPWEGKQTIARSGETRDLSGTLEAPAVARSGGTLRVVNATVDLAGRFGVGAKGGGSGGGTTGKVVLDNATVRRGGMVALNSTDSVITHTRFEDFPETAVTATWNGGTYECNAAARVGTAFRFNIQQAAGLVLRRFLVEDGAGLATGFLGNVQLASDAVVEDSGIARPRGGGLFHRVQPGDADLRRSNMPGPPGAVGARDDAEHLEGLPVTPFNATGNWWGDAAGPGKGGTGFDPGEVAPLLAPHAAQAHAPSPCLAWDTATADPRDDAPVDFRDRTIDPSALGLAERAWDFGDGQAASHAPGAEVRHRFPDGGTYTVELRATSHSGASAALARAVGVRHTAPRPALDAEVVDEVTAVRFRDRSTHGNPNDAPPGGWQYRWTLGDGATSAEREPEHRYADGGSYAVRLNATDNDGLQAEVARTVVVPHVAPVPTFTVEGALETDTFVLTDASTHPNAPTDRVVNRTWSCTDGFAGHAAVVHHRFPDGGTYRCTLTVRDDDGVAASVTRDVAVAHVAPAPDFAAPGGPETSILAFTDQSTHPNAPRDAPPAGWAWAWDLGDGTTSQQRHPARRFADGGTYEVTLTATDDDGLGATVRRAVAVAHVAPVAAFDFGPEDPEPGEAVAFTDASVHPNAPGDAVVAWAWDFGDGHGSAGRHPAHAYADPGNYDVTLTVTDDDGLVASATRRVAVGNVPPVPSWTLSPAEPTDLDWVQFTDASTDEDGEVVAWAWDFGDGAASPQRHPVHRWTDDGAYEVALTVTDDRGATATLRRTVVVRNVAPEASFAFGPDDPVAGQPVQFTDGSVDLDGAVVAWAWDFGDGHGSDQPSPQHAWAAGGDYAVTLVVTDDDGATASYTREVHVCQTRLDLARLFLEVCLRVPL